MGVFMVVRAGTALIGLNSEMLVSYRWAPTKGSLSYLLQMTDAGSVPCSREVIHRSMAGHYASAAQTGIELASCLMHLAGDPGRATLVRLLAVGAGFRTFPQEFVAVLRR